MKHDVTGIANSSGVPSRTIRDLSNPVGTIEPLAQTRLPAQQVIRATRTPGDTYVAELFDSYGSHSRSEARRAAL